MINYHSLFIDETTLTAINSSRKGLLTVPTEEQNSTLYSKGDGTSKWREVFEVKDTKYVPAPNDPQNTGIFTVQYKVSDESPYEPNVGRVLTLTYWVTLAAIKDATHADHKKTVINLAKMSSLLRACGVEVVKDDSGRVAFADYFNGTEDEPTKALVGKTFIGVVRQYNYHSNKTNETETAQDIDNFIKLDV